MTNWGRARSAAEWRFREEEARRAFEGSLGAIYEFEGLLGHGGMGNVALARHRARSERVAIKLLHPELSRSEFLPRFRREARTVARIRSKHVARILEVGELEGGVPYIVMEHLDGVDLADWLASRGRVPMATAVDFALQALDALGEAHTTGIVHRDLKPANLFATNDGDGRYLIKVLDFGVAKSLGSRQSSSDSLTAPGTLVGSPCYMPPEQLLEAEKADARSDIWALGATLFELLTGEPPFHAPSMPQLYAAIVHGPIRRTTDLVAETPRWLDAIVSKCLNRRPDDRFENAEALRHALEDGFVQSAVETLPDLRIPPPASTTRPRVDEGAGHGLATVGADACVYRTLLESTRAIPWKLEWQSMRFTYIGPQIEALLGWPAESWKTVEDWAERIHPDDRQRVVEFCVSQSKAGVDHEAEYRAMTKSGRYVWLRDVVHVRRDEEGNVESLVGFMFDITDRKQNEQQMVLRRLAPMEAVSE